MEVKGVATSVCLFVCVCSSFCRLVVRIRADCANLVLQLGVKFGCSVSTAKNLLHVAASMGLAVVGVRYVGCCLWSVAAIWYLTYSFSVSM